MAKKRVKKSSGKNFLKEDISKEKIKGIRTKNYPLLLNNIIIFLLLFVVSVLLANVSTQEVYVNLFVLLSYLFGFVLVALFIALLVVNFLRISAKNRK